MSDVATKSIAKPVLIFTGVIALLLGLWSGQHLLKPPPLPALTSGTALPEPRPLIPFTLTDHHGQSFDLTRFKGAWTLLFSWVPVIGDVLTTMAGLMRTPLVIFLPMVAAGKALRYLAVAGIVQWSILPG